MRRNRKPRTLQLGTVSHATMREEDLIPAFISVAEDLILSHSDRKTLNELRRRHDRRDYDAPYSEDDDPSGDLEMLFDLLDRYTPDYCYFGAHPGDGSDYGVWPVEDLFSDTHQGSYDGFVYRLRENVSPSEEKIDKQYTHALAVSDHGNATLYRRAGKRWIEVWSIV